MTTVSRPAGMTINPSTGLISWTPTAVGSSSATVQASNPVGQTSQTFTSELARSRLGATRFRRP
jgi:hypothetical protein